MNEREGKERQGVKLKERRESQREERAQTHYLLTSVLGVVFIINSGPMIGDKGPRLGCPEGGY
jgi:hypothetical protein